MKISTSLLLNALMVVLTSVPFIARVYAATYTNPILYADYSDPDVIRIGNHYYMVASTFHFSPGIPLLESNDLVHWTIVAHAVQRLTFDARYDLPGPLGFDDHSAHAQFNSGMGHGYSAGIWAPAIRYHHQRFYIFFPTPTEGIFMVSAIRPEGPWSKPVAVITQPNLEDPCPFWDDDGKAYLVHSIKGAGPLILHRMSSDGTHVLDTGRVIVQDAKNLPTLEGPKLYKRNGYYYIFAPYGGVETGSQAVLRSRNIYGPYEFRTVLSKGDTTVQGPHQGGYVETLSGDSWFIHFNSTGAYGRIVYLEPVQWKNDWPIIGNIIDDSTAGEPVTSHALPDVKTHATAAYPQMSDEFSSSHLGLQWEWNHNPDDAHWSLTKRRGFLRLDAMYAGSFLAARNTLTQVQFGRVSQFTVRMDAREMSNGQHAGLGMLQIQPNWIGIVKSEAGTSIVTSSAGVESKGITITQSVIQLRMNVHDEKVSYSYSIDDGKTFIAMGEWYEMHFSWWKGARPALFSYSIDASSVSGHADFDWAHVEQMEPARE
ncbi:MAG: glycoside hydrolase 43 family protein [Steroidobacter sp.]